MANILNKTLIKLLGKSNLAFTLTMTAILFAFVAIYLTLPGLAANLRADFSNNGSVGNEDFIILKDNWNKTNATHNMGDANNDGRVDIYDLSILVSEWGQATTPTPTPSGQPANSINVKDAPYNAKGDGSTSDNAAILSAISAARGKIVYFPAGIYKLSTRLAIPEGAKLKGDGNTSWINGPLRPGSTTSYSDLRIGSDHYDTSIYGVSNVSFTNVKFHGGGGDGSAVNGHNPHPGHVVTIGSAWSGSDYSVSHILFNGCTFERNHGIENSSKSLNYVGVAIKAGSAATDSYVDDVLFKNSTFEAGAPSFTVEMWQDYSKVCYVGMTNISFEGCIFEAGESASIDYSGGTNAAGAPSTGYAHVTGCTFKGNGAPPNPNWINDVTVEKGAGYVVVSGNTFYRGAGAAFAVEDNGCYCEFNNNIIDSTNNVFNTGITHWYVAYVSLGNDSNAHHNTVTGNTVISTGPNAYCIQIRGHHNTVTGNTLTGGGIENLGSGNTVNSNTFL